MEGKRRILVADDQKGVRRLLEELFRKEGFEVAVACDGQEAVDKTRACTPDVILMDMKMPNMNGLEASSEIFRMKLGIPIIMMTAYGEMEVVKKALEIGVKKYITKPFDIMDLRHMVKEVLEEKETGE
jgi:two-component system response regulator (stage 0 sporulation protein F)